MYSNSSILDWFTIIFIRLQEYDVLKLFFSCIFQVIVKLFCTPINNFSGFAPDSIAIWTVRMLREELQLLQEPGSYVGEVVKVMGKNKVLVKVSSLSVLIPPWSTMIDNFVFSFALCTVIYQSIIIICSVLNSSYSGAIPL